MTKRKINRKRYIEIETMKLTEKSPQTATTNLINLVEDIKK